MHPHRASPYDTAVFVYQSQAQSSKRAIDATALEAALRRAFAACVPTAAASEKQAARRGSKDVRAWSGKKKKRKGGDEQMTKTKRVRQKEA